MSQQTELAAAKRELADAQQLAQLSETRLLDAQEQLEMAMLDKEVAEERSELAETELEELKEKYAVLEVEIKVVREGAGGTCKSCRDPSPPLTILSQENTTLILLRIRWLTFNLRSRMSD